MEIGYGNTVGRIDLPLQGLAAPARYRLVVEVEGTTFANDWDLWVHPRAAQVATQVPSNVTIATQINAAMEAKLSAGETVWLMLAPSQIRGDADKGPIALGFSSIFWNTVWTNGQAPHSLGILCDPQDPALAGFPTDAYSNWQWWYPIKKGAAMILDGMPHELRPTIQVVDDWVTNRKLALALEAKAGRGRLLVTSVDFAEAALDPVRRQLRASLLAYLSGPLFQPKVSLTADQVRQVVIPN